jgi:multiple sugar transport system permease protein
MSAPLAGDGFPAAPVPWARTWDRVKVWGFPYLLIAPSVLCLSGILLYPILKGVLLSFYAVKFAEAAPFVGLANYRRLFHDPAFWRMLQLTLTYTFFSVIGTFGLALAIALLLNKTFRGRTAVRAILTLPWAIPEVAAVLVWTWMFDYQYGVVNYLLKQLHVVQQSPQWLMNPHLALASVLMVTIWKVFPLSTLVLLAGLQSISPELYEAARMDGAQRFQQFWYVTKPGLRSIASILLLLITIWSFRRFTIIWVMTQGGPMDATQTLVVGVYRYAFNYFDMGYAAALGVIGFILSIIATLCYFTFDRRMN